MILVVALLISVLMILFLRTCSAKLGLLDHPGGRKQHSTPTPTVGGLAMFAAVVFSLTWFADLTEKVRLLIECAGALVALGVLDDRHGLPVNVRMMIQVCLALVVILGADGVIFQLGPILGGQFAFHLGIFAIPFSVIAIVGGINAMNMIDGADGMAGKMALISSIGLLLLFSISGNTEVIVLLWAMIGALVGFLIFNTRIFVKKAWVFMGDAGSMWLGFVLAWLFIQASHGETAIEPALAMWLFGIPLMDTVLVMTRRMRQRRSPFSADRTHIHYVLMDMGHSVRRTVLALSLVQIAIVGVGVTLYVLQAPSWLVFWGFMVVWLLYFLRFRKCNG